jgi:hypothetical protein
MKFVPLATAQTMRGHIAFRLCTIYLDQEQKHNDTD